MYKQAQRFLILLLITYPPSTTPTTITSNPTLVSNVTVQSTEPTSTPPPPPPKRLKEPYPLTLPLLQNGLNEDNCKDFVESSSNNEFSSPNYPGEYFHNINCVKVISAEEGQVIRLRFLDHFHLEPDDKCQYDYLEVRDGPYGYSTHIVTLCGTSPPSFIMSSGRHLWLHFTSDKDIHYVGFKASYEFIPSPNPRPDLDDCSFHLTSLDEEIMSDNITDEILATRRDNAINFVDCTWKIEAPENYRIMLQFIFFKMEKANDCNYNVVEIYGERTEYFGDDGIIKQYCSSETEAVLSRGRVMHFRFFSVLSGGVGGGEVGFMSKMHVYYSFYRDVMDKGPDGKYIGPETCTPEEFDCTDNTCIDKKLMCNHKPNCKQTNDEDKDTCNFGKAGFSMKMDLIVIAFIGCFLAAGMCSGLFLNICRKLRQDKIELEEIRVKDSHPSTTAPPLNLGSP